MELACIDMHVTSIFAPECIDVSTLQTKAAKCCVISQHMVASSNGNIFHVNGPCEGNPPVTGGFPSQRPVTLSFGIFFDRRQNKRLDKQSRRRWFETPSHSLWRQCNYWIPMRLLLHYGSLYADNFSIGWHEGRHFRLASPRNRGGVTAHVWCNIDQWALIVHVLFSRDLCDSKVSRAVTRCFSVYSQGSFKVRAQPMRDAVTI